MASSLGVIFSTFAVPEKPYRWICGLCYRPALRLNYTVLTAVYGKHRRSSGGRRAGRRLPPRNSAHITFIECRYGVKWPNGGGFAVLMAGMRRSYPAEFDTPWGAAASSGFVGALSARFPVRSVMSMPKKAVVSADTASMIWPVNRP